MMRAARFTSQLGFTVDEDVRAAMQELVASIDIVSAERVRDELVKLLNTDDPVPGLRLLVDTGLAERFLPELPEMRLEVDEHHHHKDVYEHSLTVLEQAIGYEAERHAGDPRTPCSGSRRCCTTSASPRRASSSPAAP